MTAEKIWARAEAAEKAEALRKAGKKIVFTNGCFDILHAGHVAYLQEAASLGDLLIVGLNTDNSVKRLEKSPARPLQNEYSRSRVMAALGCVAAVVLFDEDTPKELIEEIVPAVLVKGADYLPENIAGAEFVLNHGGKVQTIAFLPGFSTSAIEKKILEAHKPT
jgi:rfaE bifunctional protein nucleotidyltransferase chain/domain